MKKPDATCKHCLQPMTRMFYGWRHTRGGRSTNLVCKKPTPLTEDEEKALAESLKAAVRGQFA